MSKPKLQLVGDGILVLIFVVVLFVPLIAMFLGVSAVEDTGEKRVLASMPDFSTEPIDGFPQKLDAYFQDRFAFRQQLIRLQSRLRHGFLRVSTDKVIVGQDDWLYYAESGLIEDYTGQNPFSDNKLAAWKALLENHHAQCAARGAKYLFVIAPNKATIYPEHLPEHIQSHRGQSRREQLVDYLGRHSSVPVLDLTVRLKSQKTSGPLYFKDDTHWNGSGRFIGYRAIHERIAAATEIGRRAELGVDWRVHAELAYGYTDLVGMLGLQKPGPAPALMLLPLQKQPEVAAEINLPLDLGWPDWLEYNKPMAFEATNGSGRLLMTHDSFFRAGVLDKAQPLARHFSRSAFVWTYPTNRQFEALLKLEAPNFVVEARAERSLAYLPAAEPAPAPAQDRPIRDDSVPAPTYPFGSISGITEPARLFDGLTRDPEKFSTAPLNSPVLLEFREPKRVASLTIQLYDLDDRLYRFTVEALNRGRWRLVHDRSADGQAGLVTIDLDGEEVKAFRIVGLYNSDIEFNPTNRVLHLQEVSVEFTE